MKARFLATMSHELRQVLCPWGATKTNIKFRTPLNSVVVLSDLLLEAQLEPKLYECRSSSEDFLVQAINFLIRCFDNQGVFE